MKRKVVLAVFMSMALAFSVAGCGASSAGSTSAAESAASETVYGEVTSVDGNSVTVTVGTMETSESGGPETFTAGSDSKTYDLSDATITKESMGGGALGGQAPSGTDGSTDSSSDGQTPPEKPSGTENGTDRRRGQMAARTVRRRQRSRQAQRVARTAHRTVRHRRIWEQRQAARTALRLRRRNPQVSVISRRETFLRSLLTTAAM